MNWENKRTWSFQDKCLYFKRWVTMKQLGAMNFASLTEKSSKIQHKAVSQNQRKYMAQKHAID